jgi:hypothetical protein
MPELMSIVPQLCEWRLPHPPLFPLTSLDVFLGGRLLCAGDRYELDVPFY